MKEFYKVIYEALGDSLQLPTNDGVLAAIIAYAINQVAFRGAWNDVGFLYRTGLLSGREAGSFLHWLFRSVRYLLIWGAVYVVMAAVQFIEQHWKMIALVLMCLAAVAVIVCAVRYRLNMKRVVIRKDDQLSAE